MIHCGVFTMLSSSHHAMREVNLGFSESSGFQKSFCLYTLPSVVRLCADNLVQVSVEVRTYEGLLRLGERLPQKLCFLDAQAS